MTTGLTIEMRSSTQNRDDFDMRFSVLPELIAKKTSLDTARHSAQLWLQLLLLGEQRVCEFWLARSKHTGETIARIGADVPRGRPLEGSIGFFDCGNDAESRVAAATLIEVATRWLAERGVTGVYAPMDFNSWFNYRFKVRDANRINEADQSWEPCAPEFHREIFINAGFSGSLEFSSLAYELPNAEAWLPYLDKLRPTYDSLTHQHGYTLRALSQGEQLIDDLRALHELSHLAFVNNPMFEPIPFQIFASMTMALMQKYDLGPTKICFGPNGAAVGFALCFCENGELVYKTVAVHPEHRSIGVANALTYEISNFCHAHKILKCTGALIRDGNVSERIGKGYGQFSKSSHVHNYVLLKKVLT